MHRLMNHYMGKFSTAGLLRSPPGEQSNAGGTGNGGSGNGDSSGGDGDGNEDGDGNGDKSQGAGTDDDDDVRKLLGDDGEIDDEDFGFLGEAEEYKMSAEEQEAAKNLGTQIQQQLEEYSIADADIPDDFDPTDKASLKTLLNNTQRGAIQSTMKMMIPIINHALGTATKQMRQYMESSAKGRGKQSAAAEAFRGLGFSNPEHVAMAKPIYAQALRANRGDAAKAAKATRRAFASMGINLPAGGGGTSGGTNNGGGGKSGTRLLTDGAALDDLFGKPTK